MAIQSRSALAMVKDIRCPAASSTSLRILELNQLGALHGQFVFCTKGKPWALKHTETHISYEYTQTHKYMHTLVHQGVSFTRWTCILSKDNLVPFAFLPSPRFSLQCHQGDSIFVSPGALWISLCPSVSSLVCFSPADFLPLLICLPSIFLQM